MNFNVKVEGLEKTIKQLGIRAGREAIRDVEKITETYARKMANEAAIAAPIDSGQLKGSIVASPKKVRGEKAVWQWGSNLEYARVQEYTHPTSKGFIRRSIWANRQDYRDAVRRRLAKGR